MKTESLEAYKPSENLYSKVLTNIRNKNVTNAKKRASIFFLLGILTLIACIGWSRQIMAEIHQSGFYEYMKLIFSDGLSYWKEIGLSLLESLPSDIGIILLSILFAMLMIVRQIFKNLNIIRKRSLTL